jgi:glycogen debranching enzyme
LRTLPDRGPIVERALRRAREDLLSLRLSDFDAPDGGWTLAAGVPIYVALFGRDTLTTSWQAAFLGPELLSGTLRALARYQGTETNPWRDEQPGRHLHEAHTSPLATLNILPRSRYYGSLTTSILFPFLVAELWHWTGDKARVAPFLEPALKGLQWADTFSNPGGRGFYKYKSMSPKGTRHQGWKDSSDAIVDVEGRDVEPPIAMCEEQSFAYVSKLHLAETLWWFGRHDEAKRLFHEANELKKRFNEAFWMPDLGFLAMALGPNDEQIKSIGSDAGHALPSGILDPSLARTVADRLMREDLFSGWGVRTLSSEHRAYNPFSYHRGSVWPVEQGTFTVGFARFGFHDLVERLSGALFDACALFENFRLPELFSGHPRDRQHPFPALYPQANSPQAWSSSMVFNLIQSLLGLYPYAPLNTLLVDPRLPPWLPEISIRHLRVGTTELDLRFRRDTSGKTMTEILRKEGPLKVLHQPNPWSLTATPVERVRDFIDSLSL